MKSKVRLSIYSMIVTLLVTVALIAGAVWLICNGEDSGYFVAVILLFILISAGLYGPLSIAVDKDHISINSLLRNQRLPLSDVYAVELFQPTMGAIRMGGMRLFGSGGYMGYWGVFREGDIGKYVAYYGKASDCFLVVMKNGTKYVLGCENPEEMVEYIKSQLH